MNIQNLLSQLSMSSNPFNMILSMLPNKNQQETLSALTSANSDEQRAQILADLCNKNHITKQQLNEALQNAKKN